MTDLFATCKQCGGCTHENSEECATRCNCPMSVRAVAERKTLLEQAHSLIYGDRADAYGDYADEAKRLAQMWGAYLGIEMRAEQVPALLVLLKVCRLSHDPTHTDSWVDIAGYAGCAGKLESVWGNR